MNILNERQLAYLQSELAPQRVNERKVGGGRKASYLEAWDVRRTLIRIFGYGGFSIEVLDAECVVDQPKENINQESGEIKTTHNVVYTVRVLLKIFWTLKANMPYPSYIAVATGSAENQPNLADAHDLAIKSAESDAIKRAAINLGTQFGLSLYQNGTKADVVKWTLVDDKVPDNRPVDENVTPDAATDTPQVETPQADAGSDEGEKNIPADDTPPAVPDLGQEVEAALDALRKTYDKRRTSTTRIQMVAGIREGLSQEALATIIDTKDQGSVTLERLCEMASQAAVATPAAEVQS